MEKSMSEKILAAPVELTDAELDYVSGGKNDQEGLVNVNDVEVNVAIQALNNKSGISQRS
jgi:hypothetical protein